MSIDPGWMPELLTVADVARLLKISISSVRRLQQRRRLPFIKVGGRIRYARSDVADYLERQRVGTIDTSKYGSTNN
jgi:excisionase family DNA binding protein